MRWPNPFKRQGASSTQNMTTPLVSTKEVDYLDEDKPIRGQNYVCLSFLSPEQFLKEKDVYAINRFLGQFAKDVKLLFEGMKQRFPDVAANIDQVMEVYKYVFDENELQEQYKFYRNMHAADIDREFSAENDFQTCVRGIKVRGVFDTLKEAQVRAEVLKRQGDKFDIFIGQVGCWCPWSPSPELLDNQEYADTALNTLMKKYKDNMAIRDEVYEQRKQEKMRKAMTDGEDPWLAKRAQDSEAAAAAAAAAGASSSADTEGGVGDSSSS